MHYQASFEVPLSSNYKYTLNQTARQVNHKKPHKYAIEEQSIQMGQTGLSALVHMVNGS